MAQPRTRQPGNGMGDVTHTGDNPVLDVAIPHRQLPPVVVDMVRVDEEQTPACIGVGGEWFTVGDLKEMVARFGRAIDMAASHRSLRGFVE